MFSETCLFYICTHICVCMCIKWLKRKIFLVLKNIVLIKLELIGNKGQIISTNPQYLGKCNSLPREQYVSRSTHYFLPIPSLTSPPTLYLMTVNENGHLFLLVFKLLLMAPIFYRLLGLIYSGVIILDYRHSFIY